MKPNTHLLLATVAALGVALAFPTMAEGLATKKTTGEAKDKGFEKEIQVESWSFGGAQPKTGGQNQMKMNDSAQPKKSGDPMPTESFSVNYEKVKSGAPKGAVAQPPGKAAGADGAVDAADYVLWRKTSDAPASGPGKVGTPQQPPQPAGLLLPAVQSARDAAKRPGNAQEPGRKTGTAVKKQEQQKK